MRQSAAESRHQLATACSGAHSSGRRLRTWLAHLPSESVLAMPDRPASELEPMPCRWLRAACSRAAATAPHGTRSSCFAPCAEVVSAAVGSRVTSPARYCMRTWLAHLPSESVLAMPDRSASELEPMPCRCRWLRAACSHSTAWHMQQLLSSVCRGRECGSRQPSHVTSSLLHAAALTAAAIAHMAGSSAV